MIKEKIKNLISKKRIFALILIVSLGANIFFFGKQWYERRLTKSFNQGIIWVFQQAQKLGQVSYTDQNGNQIILEVKK